MPARTARAGAGAAVSSRGRRTGVELASNDTPDARIVQRRPICGVGPSNGTNKAKRAALGVVPANGADRPPASKPPAPDKKRRKLLQGGQLLQPDASFEAASASFDSAAASTKPGAKKPQRNATLFSSFVDKANFKVPKMKGTVASARLLQQQRDARKGRK